MRSRPLGQEHRKADRERRGSRRAKITVSDRGPWTGCHEAQLRLRLCLSDPALSNMFLAFTGYSTKSSSGTPYQSRHRESATNDFWPVPARKARPRFRRGELPKVRNARFSLTRTLCPRRVTRENLGQITVAGILAGPYPSRSSAIDTTQNPRTWVAR